MHELLRHYAAERLAAEPAAEQALRDQHCAYFAAAFQRWGQELRGHRQKEALASMVAESENGRAAGEWASERRNLDWIEQALDGLVAFYIWRGRDRDGETICRLATEALAGERSPAGLRVRAATLFRQSRFTLVLGENELSEQQVRQGETLLGQAEADGQDVRAERANAIGMLAAITLRSNLEEAYRLNTKLLALRRELGDPWRLANALAILGAVAWQRGAYDEMEQCYKEDLDLRQQLGDQWGRANALSRLGTLALNRQRFVESERLERESVALYRELGDQARLAQALGDLGATFFWLGQLDEACTVIEENLPIFEHLGRRLSLAHYTVVLGRNEMHRGDYAQACARAGRGVELARELGANRQIAIGLSVLGSVALAEGDSVTAQRLLQESTAVYQQLGQGEELSWSLATLAIAEHRLGNPDQAAQHLAAALQAVAEIQAFKAMALILPTAALILAGRGEHTRALEIAALAARYPVVANSRWYTDAWHQHLDALAAELPAETVAAAKSRGQARDLEETKHELLAEFVP
jgi:tetratricopeptide (TPR) repeat protein